MTHYDERKWIGYIDGSLKDEREREEMESHLYACDRCLTAYVNAVEQCSEALPSLDHPRRFAERAAGNPVSGKSGKKKWHRRSLSHYFIAAGVTMILMTSGTFSQLVNWTTQYAEDWANPQGQTFSKQWTDKASLLLDTLPIHDKRR